MFVIYMLYHFFLYRTHDSKENVTFYKKTRNKVNKLVQVTLYNEFQELHYYTFQYKLKRIFHKKRS